MNLLGSIGIGPQKNGKRLFGVTNHPIPSEVKPVSMFGVIPKTSILLDPFKYVLKHGKKLVMFFGLSLDLVRS